jgi:hypothetical protein
MEFIEKMKSLSTERERETKIERERRGFFDLIDRGLFLMGGFPD